MEKHNLEGAWARVRRAEAEANALYALWGQFADDSYRSYAEKDPNSGEVVVYVEALREPPSVKWGPLIGEIVHNLRSALDHLVWTMTETESGPAPPHPIPQSSPWREVGFPIVGDENNWPDMCSRRLWGVNPEFQRGFIAYQPFNTGPKALEREPLFVLKELWDIDKHRHAHLVNVLAAHPKDFQIPTGVELPDYIVEERFPGRPFKGRTEIRRFRGSLADAHVDRRFLADVAFAEGPPAYGGGLFKTFGQIAETVTDILETCTPVGTG